jgi:uncharacterized protein DUF2314
MPTYERGDYVKVEFQDETTVIGEWMWVRVHHCDDEKELVFGTLDNEPLNDYEGKVDLGSELAVRYSQIREHKKASMSCGHEESSVLHKQKTRRPAAARQGDGCSHPAFA